MTSNTYDSINEYRNIFWENNNSFSSYLSQSQNNNNLDIFNQINSINKDDQFCNNHIPSHYLINQTKIEIKNTAKRTKTTLSKTDYKIEENDEPMLFTPNDILNIFNKESNKDICNESLTNLKFRKDIIDNLQLSKKKRKRDDFEYDENKNNELEDDKNKKKRGRAKINLNRLEIHDKMCPDNIIKKVKSSIFNFILFFLNNLLSTADEIYNGSNNHPILHQLLMQ